MQWGDVYVLTRNVLTVNVLLLPFAKKGMHAKELLVNTNYRETFGVMRCMDSKVFVGLPSYIC